MSRVTIAVPTYNRDRLLGETLHSLLEQDYRDKSIVVVDDGSTDATRDVVAAFERDHPGVVRYVHQENAGESAAVNRAWSMADGEYFASVSSDDPVMPGWLTRMVAFMDAHPDIVVAYPDWNVIDDKSAFVRRMETIDYSRSALVSWAHCLPGPGALIRRSPLAGVTRLRDPRYGLVTDYECWLRLCMVGPFARVPEVLANWRMHESALTVAAPRMRRAADLRRVVRDFYRRNDLPREIARLKRFALSRACYASSDILRASHPLRSYGYYLLSCLFAWAPPPGLPREFMRPRPTRRTKWLISDMKQRLRDRGQPGDAR